MRAERQDRLRDALNGMEPIDREIIVLRHFEELSNVEVADVLEIRTSAASKRYLRALRKLREVLDGIPSFFESAAFLRSSFSPSTIREPEGRPLRIKSASSAKLLIERPRTFLPPRTAAIDVEVIVASWLFIIRQLATMANLVMRPNQGFHH